MECWSIGVMEYCIRPHILELFLFGLSITPVLHYSITPTLLASCTGGLFLKYASIT